MTTIPKIGYAILEYNDYGDILALVTFSNQGRAEKEFIKRAKTRLVQSGGKDLIDNADKEAFFRKKLLDQRKLVLEDILLIEILPTVLTVDEIEVKAGHGTIIARAFGDPGYSAINVDYRLNGKKLDIPVALVEDPAKEHSEPNEYLSVYTYGKPFEDDFTHKVSIPLDTIKEFYKENEPEEDGILDEQTKEDLRDYYDNLDPAYRNIFWDVLCNIDCQDEFKDYLEETNSENNRLF